MTTHGPTLAAFALTSGEERRPQPPNTNGAAILSLALVQALCWLLVFSL